MKRYSSQHDTLKTEINIKMETGDMSGCIVRVELLPVENVHQISTKTGDDEQ